MTSHVAVSHAVAFVERHGYALLFWWVLAEQGAIPLPSVPLLLAAGALMRAGRLNVLFATTCCLIAALIADTTWFLLGKIRGRRVLRLMCRFSLEPDSCVRKTENTFLKYGLNSLFVSKFVPGLNAVAAPMAGITGRSYGRFLLYDGAGALIWSATYLGLGYVFSEQLETAFDYAARLGSGLLVLVVSFFVLWIAWKFVRRRRLLETLNVARITPRELQDRLTAGEDLFILDLRNRKESSASIPGATRIAFEDLAARVSEIPRDREIIVFCT